MSDDSQERAIGHTASSMYALAMADLTHMLCGNYVAGGECRRELAALADEKVSLYWKIVEQSIEARHLALTGDPAKALPMLIAARNAFRSTGANYLAPLDLSVLASTYAVLGKFDDAWRCIAEALNTIETNQEKWFEVEVNRIAGEVARKSPAPHTAKAAGYFERALAIARQQQANRAELACTRFDSGADRSPVRHVDALENRPALVCSGNLLSGCTAVRLVEIADHNRKTVFSQAGGDCSPDAARRAGNNRAIPLI